MYLVILLYASFAILFSLSKEALYYVEPFFFIGFRMAVFGVFLLIIQLLLDRKKFLFFKICAIELLLFCFTAIYLTNIAEIWAIKLMPSSKVCLMYSLSPFSSTGIAFLVLREKMNKKKWLGFAIGFTGVLPVFAIGKNINLLSLSSPEIVMFVAIISNVYGWILLKKLALTINSTLMVNGIGMLFGGILALLHSYLAGENWHPIPVNNFIEFVRSTFLISIISNLWCYNLYGYLLKKFSATFMSFAGLITPLFASFFGWLFLQEKVEYMFFISLIIFFIGLLIFYAEEIKLGEIKWNKLSQREGIIN
jgi:drug/metabolite transporter (DMT)-like permease